MGNEPLTVRVVVGPVFGTNCVVLARGGDCVVVDPGPGVADEVVRMVEEVRLAPRAVLATHGHADHTWDGAVLCDRFGVPFVLHTADAYRLDDPFGTIDHHATPAAPGPVGQALRSAGADPDAYRAPRYVQVHDPEPGAPQELEFGDVALSAVHAPGHTEGSTLYLVGSPADGVLLSGDVLFAGTIGRTDLPGGDDATMARTLHDVRALDDAWSVIPGHGPSTTIRRECQDNPFLRQE